MKKQFALILLCFALLCLTACGAAEPKTTVPDTSEDTTAAAETTALPETTAAAETETETEASTEPEMFVAATVSVRFADGSLPPQGQYDTFHRQGAQDL